MPVTALDILTRDAYEGGRAWGDVGAYERIDAVVHYAVSPGHPSNETVVDLELAERGDDGLVHFSGDLTILRPVEAAAGNRALLLQVPNRGRRLLGRFHMSEGEKGDDGAVLPGDGFLFRHGWTIAWAGWQWDVPVTPERYRIGLAAPQVPAAARTPHSRMQLRYQLDRDHDCLPLTDHHVGDLGRHQAIPAADREEADARLLVRDWAYGPASEIPRGDWRFAGIRDGAVVAGDSHVWLAGGFQAGRIYDLLYTPLECPVVGAGMLALRDVAAYLRRDREAPTAGSIDHVIAEGQSQCGRLLRTLLYNGLNLGEDGAPAFDGVLAHIAGGRRGEFNHRFGQPSVQPTPSFGHLFPFADEVQHDPLTDRSDGLLARQRAAGAMPRIIYTDTSSEYWRGDAGLSHTDLTSGGDAEPAAEARRYLFSSTQHGAGILPLSDSTVFGTRGSNPINIVDYRPLYRAALSNLLAWISSGTEPPASVFPRAADDTRLRRAEVVAHLAGIPGLALPAEEVMTSIRPLDLGPDAARGIAVLPAAFSTASYPDWVSVVDGDGNETAGIAMPDVSVPVATHTGFNPRHPDTGGAGQLLEYIGSSLPLAADEETRSANGDPRPSLAARYRDREDYLAKVRAAAEALIERRHLLAEDLDTCLEIAARRYDACLAWPNRGS